MFVAARSALEQQMTARIQTEVELLTENYRSGCQFQKTAAVMIKRPLQWWATPGRLGGS